MEILFLIAIIVIVSLRKTGNYVEIQKLPVKLNPKGFYEEDAFTEIYHKFKKK